MRRRAAKLARDLYGDVKSDLQRSGQGFAGLSKNDIMRRFTGMPRMSDNLKRDEQTFRNTVWPLLEAQRKADGSVVEAERVQRGRPVNFWVIK